MAELTDKLTMAGVEVEAASDLSGGIDGVITAEILEVGSHPNADKLSLCTVKSMDSTYTIVCGAKNMKAGDRVALALHGAMLPGGIKLKKSKIRGVASEGMMCSEVELGLANTSDGIMILPKDTELGVDIKDALGLNDHALEVCITPNRADCLSIRGLAREISAVTGAKFIASAMGGLEEDKEEAKDNIKITLAQRESPQLMLSILLSSFSKVLRKVSIPIPCIFPPRISILPTQNPNKFSALCCLDIFF